MLTGGNGVSLHCKVDYIYVWYFTDRCFRDAVNKNWASVLDMTNNLMLMHLGVGSGLNLWSDLREDHFALFK